MRQSLLDQIKYMFTYAHAMTASVMIMAEGGDGMCKEGEGFSGRKTFVTPCREDTGRREKGRGEVAVLGAWISKPTLQLVVLVTRDPRRLIIYGINQEGEDAE